MNTCTPFAFLVCCVTGLASAASCVPSDTEEDTDCPAVSAPDCVVRTDCDARHGAAPQCFVWACDEEQLCALRSDTQNGTSCMTSDAIAGVCSAGQCAAPSADSGALGAR
jgi:hypothetical protein